MRAGLLGVAAVLAGLCLAGLLGDGMRWQAWFDLAAALGLTAMAIGEPLLAAIAPALARGSAYLAGLALVGAWGLGTALAPFAWAPWWHFLLGALVIAIGGLTGPVAEELPSRLARRRASEELQPTQEPAAR